MTRLSRYFLPTVKEPPADAEAISHVLMVRAGLVRQLGAGMWTWLPAGWRVHRKIEQIVREELDAIGALEMLMPVLQPEELWRRTGRAGIPELFRLEDRNDRPLVLALTHEEAVTFHASREIRSYRDLPLILYHVQVKERDEPRPRAGVLRTREFIMKDSYSFDRDEAGLGESYERAHQRLRPDPRPQRPALVPRGVRRGDDGRPRRARVHGAVRRGRERGRALGRRLCRERRGRHRHAPEPAFPPPLDAPEPVETPNARTIEEVSGLLGIDPATLIKSLPVVAPDGRMTLVLVRGDHTMNDIKLQNALGSEFRPATEEEIVAAFGAEPGFIGPVGAEVDVLADASLERGVYVTGANRSGYHLRGVEPGRDFEARFADVRKVEAGRPLPARRHDRDRAGDRGGQHLQARHPLLRAARCEIPGRVG